MKIMNQEFKKNRYKYIFLLTITVLGFVSGIVFSNILSYEDLKEVSDIIKNYFLNIKNNQDINFLSNFINVISVNYIYMILIWIFGVSIIGIILNPFILYFKSFIIGFSVGIIIYIYSFIGIIGSILYLFPHILINLIIYILLTFHSINLSIKLFKTLFLKKQFNFGELMRRYLKILAFSSVVLLISSIYETFFSDFVMKLFTFLIK